MSFRRCRRCEEGASLVEFALILPIFMMIVLGVFTGAEGYNRKLTIVAAAREATRYGATLQVTPASSSCPSGSSDLDTWLNCVATLTVQAASGALDPNTSGRSVCVAFFDKGDTDGALHKTKHVTLTGSQTPVSGDSVDGPCSGAAITTETAVQAVVKRTYTLEAMLFSLRDRTLTGSSVARYERTSS
ncbi:MAG: pilus assembly protein [Acidimicrobiales bacterium]|nr:pilus assembly protein [Acidimicrobiales bacterium]